MTTSFPDVHLFFAVKAQNNEHTRKLLAANGCGFDVASVGEMKSVLETGVAPENMIYAQPYKQPSHLHFALNHGIVSVCDAVDEIEKVGEMAEELALTSPPRILLRICPDDRDLKEGDFHRLSSLN